MSQDYKNYGHHFKDAWDQTTGAWKSIFLGGIGASKAVAETTKQAVETTVERSKETITTTLEDSRVEACYNISKDIVITTAREGLHAASYVVEKVNNVLTSTGDRRDGDVDRARSTSSVFPSGRLSNASEDTNATAAGSTLSQKLFVGALLGIVVAQTGCIVYLYHIAHSFDKPAPKWHKPSPKWRRSSSPRPKETPVAVVEEEDHRPLPMEQRLRKETDTVSLGSNDE